MAREYRPHHYQEEAIRFCLERACAGIFLEPGLGKTSITLATFSVLKQQGLVDSMIILAPLRVCYSTWVNEPKKWDFSEKYSVGILHGSSKNDVLQEKHDIYVLNYDGLPWFVENMPKEFPCHMLVVDECFVRGTRIATPDGEVKIEDIQVGDVVITDAGPRRVLDISRRKAYKLVALRLSNGTSFTCTPEHPIFTDLGWCCAKDAYGREVFTAEQVSNLRRRSSEPRQSRQNWSREDVLLEILRSEEEVSGQPKTPGNMFRSYGDYSKKYGDDLEQGDSLVRGREGQVEGVSLSGEVLGDTRWEWYGDVSVREALAGSPPEYFSDELPGSVGAKARWLSLQLQGRFRRSSAEDSRRSGREFAQPSGQASTGQEKRSNAGVVRVESIAHIECGSGEDVWNLQVEGAPRYFAEGVLAHNCTKVKHTNTQRFKTLKKILNKFRRRYILTGTPAANGLMDLFGQVYVMDLGATFGPYVTHFRNRYFYQTGYNGYEWSPKPNAGEEIQEALAPRVMTMKAEDYLKLPELVESTITVDLPEKARRIYQQMEEQLMLSFKAGDVIAANSAVASMKCRQLAGGSVYGDDRAVHTVHTAKLEALEDLIEELSGQPALVAYEFEHELNEIKKRFPNAPHIGGTKGAVSNKYLPDLITKWCRGEIPVLLANPASLAHGVDGLQGAGRAVIWYTPTWNLENREQYIRRIWRQGQTERVFVYNIIARDTVDEVVLKAVEAKDKTQTGLMNALRDYWKNNS